MFVTHRRLGLGVCSCLASLPIVGARAAAQEILYDWTALAGLGRVAACGDIDHDGVPDLAVANPMVHLPDGTGWVRVLSGSDLSLLHEVRGYPTEKFQPPEHIGDSLDGAGDFDGDGTLDVVIGSSGYGGIGRVLVLDGADGKRLFSTFGSLTSPALGSVVRGVGDVDGDGFGDIAAAGQRGTVFVWRGPSGDLFRVHHGAASYPTIDGLGDVDGDGTDDYVTGWDADATQGAETGAAVVFSGATGIALHTVYGVRPADGWFAGDHLGDSVAGVGDVDLDGVPDFAAGAPGIGWKPDLDSFGYFRVYSGADARVLLEVHGDALFPMLGVSLAGGGDVNGDGSGDVLVGSSESASDWPISGAVAVYCGRTGTMLWRREAAIHQSFNGVRDFAAILGDLDGDGVDDWGLADEGSFDTDSHLFVFAGGAGGAERICRGAPNSTGLGATLELVGPISLGAQELALRIEHALPGEYGTFFYGPTETNAPFGDGLLCAGAPLYRIGPSLSADSDGAVFLPLDFDSPPIGAGQGAWLAGTTWIVQYAYRDPASSGAGFNASDAWRVTPTP